MHRLILLARDTATVDHINGVRLDNRRENLRLATMSEQNANRPKFYGSSRFKGVHRRYDGRAWVAQISVRGRKMHLGHFETEEAAAEAYNAAAINGYGPFARLNDITGPASADEVVQVRELAAALKSADVAEATE